MGITQPEIDMLFVCALRIKADSYKANEIAEIMISVLERHISDA